MRLLLFSGGLDSTALAWSQRPDLCLTIDYGQMPAQGEIRAASGLSGLMGLRHEVLTVDLAHLGFGSLAGSETATVGSAPEWWPYRNQMLITLAAMKFVGQGLKEIMFGAVATAVHADAKNRSSMLSARWSRYRKALCVSLRLPSTATPSISSEPLAFPRPSWGRLSPAMLPNTLAGIAGDARSIAIPCANLLGRLVHEFSCPMATIPKGCCRSLSEARILSRCRRKDRRSPRKPCRRGPRRDG
ncbi:7-cyano-7-deazaguanine synthase [Rhizobium leguminosarum]|nr:7-cyano-7-deazaguanine synthase [Rhizobium leguminosarum]UIK09683.1 7-cyano-7-deazaguanine synthase [Rhizobium leguminosarum]UIL26864.1 7-cyano-7-deazaguanine synthase [Rhizobium leguminosarum]